MSRYYKRRRLGYRSRSLSPGQQRAMEHIREYENLEHRLGPIVDDVRDAFFSLSDYDLKDLFKEYGRQFGSSARNYAIETYPLWRSGERGMSGQTASRLLNLVPKYLTREKRFSIVKKLCEHHAVKHHDSVEIDRENPEQTLTAVRAAIDQVAHFSVVKSLPAHVTETVSWLNDNDVVVGRAMLTEIDKRLHLAVQSSVENNWPMIAKLVRDPQVQDFSETFTFPTGSIRVYARHQSKCFIATAVYEDPNHPDVRRLRVWRERTLRPRLYGRFMIWTYRWLGPLGAAMVRGAPMLRSPLRRLLEGAVRQIERNRP